MYFRMNLKMKNPTLCCCFTCMKFIELNFTELHFCQYGKLGMTNLLVRWGKMGDFKKRGDDFEMGRG